MTSIQYLLNFAPTLENFYGFDSKSSSCSSSFVLSVFNDFYIF